MVQKLQMEQEQVEMSLLILNMILEEDEDLFFETMAKILAPKHIKKSNTPCKFYLMGNCSKGSNCRFNHEIEIQKESSSRPKSTVLCKFYQNGSCTKGLKCEFLHSSKNLKEDQTCGVCLEPISKFALLENCDHTFCFSCIKNWRQTTDTKTVKTCPVCRVQSNFVVPSPIYLQKEDKLDYVKKYKEELSKVKCKYLKYDLCPFGNHCFYSHE